MTTLQQFYYDLDVPYPIKEVRLSDAFTLRVYWEDDEFIIGIDTIVHDISIADKKSLSMFTSVGYNSVDMLLEDAKKICRIRTKIRQLFIDLFGFKDYYDGLILSNDDDIIVLYFRDSDFELIINDTCVIKSADINDILAHQLINKYKKLDNIKRAL